MLTLGDLGGIPEEKKQDVRLALERLLAFRTHGQLKPIITGYGWLDRPASSDRVVTFSHSHETEAYKQAMLEDLANAGLGDATDKIRNKGSAYLWKPQFRHRDERGRVLPGKIIKDLETGEMVDLRKYKLPLSRYAKFKNSFGRLVCEDGLEWQIDVPFKTKAELLQLSALFVRGAYGAGGWPAPYDLPLIIIGRAARKYLNDARINNNFSLATRFYLVCGENEINFIIGKALQRLEGSNEHGVLKESGFRKEACLVNTQFKNYINSV